MRLHLPGLCRCICFVRCLSLVALSAAGAWLVPANAGVVGEQDERLGGSHQAMAEKLGGTATRYMERTLRISFPLRGSLAVTGTPICFRDTVLTVSHINKTHGDATARPRGLLVSVPRLDQPGKFSQLRSVKDYMLAGPARQYDPSVPPAVANDFMLLRLTSPLPISVQPLAIPALSELSHATFPLNCPRPTVNVAYHDDLGLIAGEARQVDPHFGPVRLRNAGKVPLMTFADGYPPKTESPALFGDWYKDPLIALTAHDTGASASGSAIVCPGAKKKFVERDTLHGVVVGQTKIQVSGGNGMRNVATVNLPGIVAALAKLKGITVQQLDVACRASH